MRTHRRPVTRGTVSSFHFGADVLLAEDGVLEALDDVVVPLEPKAVPEAFNKGAAELVELAFAIDKSAFVEEAAATATVASTEATAFALSTSFAIPSPSLLS